MDKLLYELDRQIDGDLLTDRLSRMLYATDASPYQQLPHAICRPRHPRDCITIVKFAAHHRLTVIPRASGTSLAGQCVGRGLIIDLSRYMNRIVDIDVPGHRAKVEPGVVCGDLNEKLRPTGFMFAPDPSTANCCTIGGMVGNNAWGIHSLRYGTTRDNTEQIEAVLSDGSTAIFGPLKTEALQQKFNLTNREGEIYRTTFDIVNRHRKDIQKRIPAPDGIIRNSGYPLDLLARYQPWQPNGPLFNLAPFLCGSEGTLALTTAIQVKIVPMPQKRILLCAHFHDIERALQSVPQILSYRPTALEIIDHHILDRTKHNLKYTANRFWLDGNPQAVLLIEFHGDYSLDASAPENVVRQLIDRLSAYSVKIVEPPQIEQVWALRKAGLGLLMGIKGLNKAVTGIEDAAVNVADLAAYVATVRNILAYYDTDCVVYGPAGRGTLHLRPTLNLNHQSGKEKYRNILDEVIDAVAGFGGSISAKHGDGRLRAYFLDRVLGTGITTLFRRLKDTYDPYGILNPNKILDAPPPEQDLRTIDNPIDKDQACFFDWTGDGGFAAAAQKCNGAGVCLQRAGRGTMCPSYMATREEKHSTRGRANVLRQMLAAHNPTAEINHRLVKEVLELCIECKGCKSECPANVDMARMKAEFMHRYYDRHGFHAGHINVISPPKRYRRPLRHSESQQDTGCPSPRAGSAHHR